MQVLRTITFGRATKTLNYTENHKVFLGISYFRNSSVRLADSNGNHVYNPKEETIKKSIR